MAWNRVVISRNQPVDESETDCNPTPGPEVQSVHLRRSTSPDTWMNELRQLQREKNQEERRSQQLRRKLADLTNVDEDEEQQPTRKKQKDDQDKEEDVTDEVKRCGKEFAVMKMPWLHRPKDMWQLAQVDDSYNPLKRFENEENRLQGQLDDIMNILPDKLKGTAVSLAPFQRVFRDAMQHERSTAANRVRSGCGLKIFGIDSLDNREQWKERIGWERSAGKWKYDAWNVEILHKDYMGKFDVNGVFLNPVLIYIFAALAFGPASVNGLKNGASRVSAQGNVLAKEWGLTHITPGAIALSAILGRWALSMDREFKNRGVETGIPYEDDFFKYLEWLDMGIRLEGSSPTKNVIREWDQIFFPDSKDSLVGPEPDAHDDNEATAGSHSEAMKALYDNSSQDSAGDDDGAQSSPENDSSRGMENEENGPGPRKEDEGQKDSDNGDKD